MIAHTLDPEMQRLLATVERVASARASVLVCGESGTGKECLARHIHDQSVRALSRFVAINCAAVPEGLLESELFGHERGAFTGAVARKYGKFELAHNGTFLLDEISEMPLLLQAKLLRALQEGEIERVGASHPVKVNVRVIATTNRDLKTMVAQHQFREDLYYRLNVISLHIPALRHRPLDIEPLARLFVANSCAANAVAAKSLTPQAIVKLKSWGWPGNVRELQNTIERAVLLSSANAINEKDLQLEEKASTAIPLQPGMTVNEAERKLILSTLNHTGQNRTRAAEMLGISVRTLRNKLVEYSKETR